ncbi:MAG: translocation/assembly module TamB [Prevotellaceae bacterium]|nr:translocation/assembly module TamB [Prevotellaceae bacterium]
MKKVLTVLAAAALSLALLFTTLVCVLQHEAVQRYLLGKVVAALSGRLNAEVSVGAVRISWINRVALTDVCVRDNRRDTLLAVADLSASLLGVDFSSSLVRVGTLRLSGGQLRLSTDAQGVLNAQPLLEGLRRNAPRDSLPSALQLHVGRVEASRLAVRYADARTGQRVEVSELGFRLSDLRLAGDTLGCLVERLQLCAFDGFCLRNLSGALRVAPQSFIEVRDLTLRDDHSALHASRCCLRYAGVEAFGSFAERVHLSLHLLPSRVDARSLAPFLPPSALGPAAGLSLRAEGLVEGTLGDLHARDLQLGFGSAGTLKASASAQGLPDVRRTFFTLDVEHLSCAVADLPLPDSLLRGKAPLRALGRVAGSGRFSGYVGDFVANGLLSSALGTVAYSLTLAPAPDSTLAFGGELRAAGFDVGRLLGDTLLGRATLYGKAKGAYDGQLALGLDVSAATLEVGGYAARGARLSGQLAGRTFRGSLACSDANLSFDAHGMVAFERERLQLDAALQLHRADLVALGLNRRDSVSRLSLSAAAQLGGSSLGRLEGRLTVDSARYAAPQGDVAVGALTLASAVADSLRRLTLTSAVLDAAVQATCGFDRFVPTLGGLLRHYLSAYHTLPAADSGGQPCRYEFALLLKDAQPLRPLLGSVGEVADSTALTGLLSSNVRDFRLSLTSPALRYAGVEATDVALVASGRDSLLRLLCRWSELGVGSLKLYRWNMVGSLANSALALDAYYETDTLLSRVSATAHFFENRQGEKGVTLDISPSEVAVGSSLWRLSPASVRLEGGRCLISHFALASDKQQLRLDGAISDQQGDTLACELHNLRAASLLALAGSKADLSGDISGRLVVGGLLAPTSRFFANMEATGVAFAQREVGNITLSSFAVGESKDIAVRLRVERGGADNLRMEGLLKANGELDATAQLRGVELHHVMPAVQSALADIGGTLSGDLSVTGPLRRLMLNGKQLRIDSGQLRVSYLNALFKMEGPVDMENSTLLVRNMPAGDAKQGKGRLDFTLGNLTQPAQLYYSLKVKPDNMYVLDLAEGHNDYFYGQGYGSGVVQIDRLQGETTISVAATTNAGTTLIIPLGKKNAAQGSSFITFVAPADSGAGRRAAPGKLPAKNLKLDLTFDVDGSTNVEMLLNPTTGDAIKATGAGRIRVETDAASGTARVFGQYTIQRGEYAIAFQGIMPKTFKVKQGGTISFNGDFPSTSASIQAIYQLRAPLSDLLGDSGQYKHFVPIECKVIMTGRLAAPDIRFEIDAPTADNKSRELMRARLTTEGMVMQFLSLLVANRFMPQDVASGSQNSQSANVLGGVLAAQLSSLISQFANVNFGFNINNLPGAGGESSWGMSINTGITDRVIFNASFEQQPQLRHLNPNNSEYTGDVDVEVLLDKSGKVRLKLFGHANDQYTEMVGGSNRYGVGMVYQEDFDTFADLWRALVRGKKK